MLHQAEPVLNNTLSQARLRDASRQKARGSVGIFEYVLCFGITLDLDAGMYFCLENCKDDH